MARVTAACIAGLLASLLAHTAFAQTAFPTHPVRFVVPFPAGGTNDLLARIVGDKLQAKWGQPVVIENKTGAGGNIGADTAYHAEPDGYTLLVSPPGPLAINQSLYRQLTYKPQEFIPLTLIGASPNLVIVRKELPVNSVQELIDYAKAHPGKVSFGTQGNGATPHLTAMMFMAMTGTQMVHVPYRGENLVLNDMIGGHVDIFFGNIASSLAQYRDGRVKVLAIADTHRSTLVPEIATTAEAGLAGLVSTSWFGFAAPPKTPSALATEIANAAIDALGRDDVKARIRAIQMEPLGGSPAEAAAFIADEARRWGDVIRKNNIVVD
jgi:tripartite-type tricarboxylate transporter receptor subunit TctC